MKTPKMETSAKITIVARWTINADNISFVLRLLDQVVSETRKEAGNLCYDYYMHSDEPGEVLIYEEYTNEEAIEAHRSSKHFREIVIEKILPHLEKRKVDVLRPV